MMFLFKLLLWLMFYPILLVAHVSMKAFEVCWFVFNSPYDFWLAVSRAVESEEKEEAA